MAPAAKWPESIFDHHDGHGHAPSVRLDVPDVVPLLCERDIFMRKRTSDSANVPNSSTRDDSNPALRMLPGAARKPLSVTRETSVQRARTLMLMHDYSQLPVMNGERTVHGMVSWKSLG